MTEKIGVKVTNVVDLVEGVRSYELRPDSNHELPNFDAGAHIDVFLPNEMVRQYSISNSAYDCQRYVITVQRDDSGRGGSKYIFDNVRIGNLLEISKPKNLFPLSKEDNALFIAGGIGITPIMSMIDSISRTQRHWNLLYCARTAERAAFRENLCKYGDRVRYHFDDGESDKRINFDSELDGVPLTTNLYCCGPGLFIDDFLRAASRWDVSRIHFERFLGAGELVSGKRFKVFLKRSNLNLTVEPGETLLGALQRNGVIVPSSCETGTCGTCMTGVLDGSVAHYDSILTDQEREENNVIFPCVSRASGDFLVLDL